jgi:DNA-binding response OmpR family regulator
VLQVHTKEPRAGLVPLPGAADAGQRVLVVDDDEYIRHLLASALRFAGFTIDTCANGRAAMDRIGDFDPDLVLLDVMMPGLDGLEVCRRLRAHSTVPIIMLTARDDELDKVVGLELGADDYITKPFSIREFRSRVRALLRRSAIGSQADGRDLISADGLEIDLAKRTVTVRGRLVSLTYVEFELLRTMAARTGRVFSRQALLEALWGDYAYREPRTIDVHVRHLREKLEADPREPELILTVRGVGYRFQG